MLKIGFTGSRGGMTDAQKQQVREALAKVEGAFEFHHGDCVGCDAQVHAIAREFPTCTIIVHPPSKSDQRAFCKGEWEELERPFLERNRAIVAATNIFFAMPSGPAKLRSGTWSTMCYGWKTRKHVEVVMPDGGRFPEIPEPGAPIPPKGAPLPERLQAFSRELREIRSRQRPRSYEAVRRQVEELNRPPERS